MLSEERSLLSVTSGYQRNPVRRFFGLGAGTGEGDETSYTDESTDVALSLARTARDLAAHINLIPFNPVITTGHRRPTPDEVRTFLAIVTNHGGHATVRGSRGTDIDAACGQLKRRDADRGGESGPGAPALPNPSSL